LGDPLGVGDRGGPESPLLLHFATLQRLRRFARYWDLVGNSGNFVETAPRLWQEGGSPFARFLAWSDWLFARVGPTESIALPRQAQLLFTYLTEELRQAPPAVAERLHRDRKQAGQRETPEFLRSFCREVEASPVATAKVSAIKRQLKHLGTGEEIRQGAPTNPAARGRS
jgi:hypothetical protein